MKNIALLMICFLCFCSHHKIIRPKKENAEAINLSDSCKSKIEQILFQQFNKRYSYFSSMKTHNNDTIIVIYQNMASKEIKDNSIWIYLDTQCNILGKKTTTSFIIPKK